MAKRFDPGWEVINTEVSFCLDSREWLPTWKGRAHVFKFFPVVLYNIGKRIVGHSFYENPLDIVLDKSKETNKQTNKQFLYE